MEEETTADNETTTEMETMETTETTETTDVETSIESTYNQSESEPPTNTTDMPTTTPTNDTHTTTTAVENSTYSDEAPFELYGKAGWCSQYGIHGRVWLGSIC